MSFVYIISEGDEGPVKIGVVLYGNIVSRLKSLQIGNPRRLSIPIAFRTFNRSAFSCERMIHKILSSERMVGEWFNLSEERAIAAIRQILMDEKIESQEIPIDWGKNNLGESSDKSGS